MNRNSQRLLDLVKLSDRPWIQGRAGTPIPGDYYYQRSTNSVESVDNNDLILGKSFCTEDWVWLPLDWRPETCRWEVDQLILEAGSFKTDAEAQDTFEQWRIREANGSLIEEEGLPAELKLMFLNHLIDKLEGK